MIALGLRWEIIETQKEGANSTGRLCGTNFSLRCEIDLLYPSETIQLVIHKINPARADRLPNRLGYHQTFLLEQGLMPKAFLAAQPIWLKIEPYWSKRGHTFGRVFGKAGDRTAGP